MAARKGKVKEEAPVVTLGPQVREGELKVERFFFILINIQVRMFSVSPTFLLPSTTLLST